uniref:Uncharacterized protein n=1 Tax=Oryza meridionalis TaxID=40149 RepID=A0A0E0D927_9ORYZ
MTGCLTTVCPCITFGRSAEISCRGGRGRAARRACCWASAPTATASTDTPAATEEPCCVHALCLQCALCQEYRHLKRLGYDPSLGWLGNNQHVPPKHNPPMRRY